MATYLLNALVTITIAIIFSNQKISKSIIKFIDNTINDLIAIFITLLVTATIVSTCALIVYGVAWPLTSDILI